MSICDSGIGIKTFSQSITINVPKDHPLIILANELPWEAMYDLIEEDLKNSTVLKRLHYGRKLKTRIHLGVYLLQKMYDFKDRQTEAAIRENAAYQIFCGYGIVDRWHCPDHTKIEKFRSRLSPKTQQQLANLLCKNAVDLGIANPNDIDIDSTVQEANITYPTDAKMLRKLGSIAFKVVNGLKRFIPEVQENTKNLFIDIKAIASKARSCFFLKKKASHEERSEVLSALLEVVSEPVMKTIQAVNSLKEEAIAEMPSNIKRAIEQLKAHGEEYLLSVRNFIATGCAEASKRLCFHLDEVGCFSKKKEHKKYEFGRAFQLVRLANNFLFVAKNTHVRMDDKKSLLPIVDEYEQYFGKGTIDSVTTDKGYYGANNIKGLIKRKIDKIGVQIPANIKNKDITLSDEEIEVLSNRRAGIEPLIGHAKQGGQLGRSRMKNDRNTESSGYAAILGFNLRQTIRALTCKEKVPPSHF
jgi:transposase, IS5 family